MRTRLFRLLLYYFEHSSGIHQAHLFYTHIHPCTHTQSQSHMWPMTRRMQCILGCILRHLGQVVINGCCWWSLLQIRVCPCIAVHVVYVSFTHTHSFLLQSGSSFSSAALLLTTLMKHPSTSHPVDEKNSAKARRVQYAQLQKYRHKNQSAAADLVKTGLFTSVLTYKNAHMHRIKRKLWQEGNEADLRQISGANLRRE